MHEILPLIDARALAEKDARSALPGSPVVPDRSSRPVRGAISRAIVWLADRLDPAVCPEPSGAPCGPQPGVRSGVT